MFNLDRLKQLAEQAVVLASGAVQQAENAFEDVVRSTESAPTSSLPPALPTTTETTEETVDAADLHGSDEKVEHVRSDSQSSESISSESAPASGQQDEDAVVIKLQESTAIPKSQETIRAEKAEALSRKLAHAFKTQKLQLEKQTLLVEKLTHDCTRLTEEKHALETTLQQHLTQEKEQKEAHALLMTAKDEHINALLKEGEQLSKKHGMLIESVRRLRKDLGEKEQELQDIRSRGKDSSALPGDNFQAAVLNALHLLQQRQMDFHTHSQRQFSEILSELRPQALINPPSSSLVSTSPMEPSAGEHVPETTLQNPHDSNVSNVTTSHTNVSETESTDAHSLTQVRREESVSDVSERVDPPDDIDDEMYNLAYPQAQE